MANGGENISVVSPNLGLYLDRPEIFVPERGLSDGKNFRIRDGQLSNENLGWTRIGSFTLDGPVIHITSFKPRGSSAIVILGTPDSLYKLESNNTVTRIFNNAGAGATHWSSATFLRAPSDNDYIYFTNGIDYVQRWDGNAGSTTSLSGQGFVCQELFTWQNMLFYGNVNEDGGANKTTSFKNSDVGEPEDLSDGLAGEFIIHNGTDPLLRFMSLNDNLVTYTAGRIIIVQLVDAPEVFVFRERASGVGPLGRGLIADMGDEHHFLAQDGQYVFDGATARQRATHIWQDVVRRFDESRRETGFTNFDEETGELFWAVPLDSDGGSYPETAYIENFAEEVERGSPQPYAFRDYPFTAGGRRSRQEATTDLHYVGDKDGKLFEYGTSQNRPGGSALDSFVRTRRFTVQDGVMRGLIRRIYPFAEKNNNVDLKVTAHLADSADGPVTTSDDTTLDMSLTVGDFFTSPFRVARYVELEFGTDGPDELWKISGWQLDTRRGGRR